MPKVYTYTGKRKQRIQLYRLHLENAQYWQKNWYIIQNNIENGLITTAEKLYEHLNSKLDRLQTSDKPHNKKKKLNNSTRDNRKQLQYIFPFHNRTVNLTNIQFNDEEYETLRLGLRLGITHIWLQHKNIEKTMQLQIIHTI
jgi:hypothetical protein